MEFLTSLKDKLSGAKTYLVALAAIIATLLAYSSGEMDIIQAGQALFASIATMTMRAGIAK